MHKKKNSASVLAGEMILTFYKPARVQKKRKVEKPADEDPATVLSEIFNACLNKGKTSFTSEALFNRLVIEVWHRHALGCFNLDRREFASRLETRGWNYDARTHLWSKGDKLQNAPGELAFSTT